MLTILSSVAMAIYAALLAEQTILYRRVLRRLSALEANPPGKRVDITVGLSDATVVSLGAALVKPNKEEAR